MADPKLKAHLKATDAEVKAFLLKLDKFLAAEVGQIARNIADKSSPLEMQRGAEAAQVLGRLMSILEGRGLKGEIGRLRQIYAEQLGFIRERFETLGERDVFSDADVTTVETLIRFDTDKVGTRVNQYVDDMRSVMMRSVLAGEEIDFTGLHGALGGRLVGNLETEVNTALQAFSRTVTAAKAKDLGYELFEYIGPEDQITRPFCEELLQKDPPIYSADEIEAMDNEQGLPVMEYCGGYNCRHQWRPIGEEEAAEMGYEAD